MPSKVRHEATCSLRQHYLDAAASQGRKPTPVPKLSDPLLTLLDRKPQKQKGKGKGGTIPARFRYRIAKLKDIAQKQTDSFVLLQAVAGTDLLHQSHGFLATAKLVQKASAVFFSKLVAVQRLEKDLKRQCGPPNNEVPSWPGLAGTLPILKKLLVFLWPPAGSFTKTCQALRPWHVLFWRFAGPFRKLGFNFLVAVEVFLVTGTFKTVQSLGLG